MNSPVSDPSSRRGESLERLALGDRDAADCGVIEVHLRELSQLFDSLDPSPFHEKDLDRNAEVYIVSSLKELLTRGRYALVLYIDQPASHSDEERVVGDAIRVHFARSARLLQRQLRQLIHRGLICFGIGLVFLGAVFIIAHIVGRLMGENPLAPLVREGLLIVGWVAMWRPLEIFLYDWWPILAERRVHDRLSRISVRIIYRNSGSAMTI